MNGIRETNLAVAEGLNVHIYMQFFSIIFSVFVTSLRGLQATNMTPNHRKINKSYFLSRILEQSSNDKMLLLNKIDVVKE